MRGRPPPDNNPRSRFGRGQHHALVLTIGLMIYLLVIWFGVTVIGDTVTRSSLMAALIVILAGMAYLSRRRSSAPDQ